MSTANPNTAASTRAEGNGLLPARRWGSLRSPPSYRWQTVAALLAVSTANPTTATSATHPRKSLLHPMTTFRIELR
ncbi:MAG: hypothetical protein ABI411_13960 [Tahibacter sp.]